EVCIVFPENSPSIVPDVDMVAHGVSNKYGRACLDRQLFGMKYSLRYAADYYVFLEYDAFLLRRPQPRAGLQANAFSTQEKDFNSDRFFHFPWIFQADALKTFADKAALEPFEKGFVDRWLACQIDRLQLPVFDLQATGEGFSRNTIQTKEE